MTERAFRSTARSTNRNQLSHLDSSKPQALNGFLTHMRTKATSSMTVTTLNNKTVKSQRTEHTQRMSKRIQFKEDENLAKDGSQSRIVNFLSKQRRQAKNKSTVTKSKIDAIGILKDAQYYFDKNPTYLKETEIGEIQGINLKKCVESVGTNRTPYFGYPLLKYEEEEKKQLAKKVSLKGYLIGDMSQRESARRKYEDPLPFRTALHSKRKEDRINEHVLKCFTFGKKVRRQLDDDGQTASRVDILKRRFQRLTLLRQYFSVNKRGTQRKFRFPVDEEAQENLGAPLSIYNELQYCQESDVEELSPQKPKKDEYQAQLLKKLMHQKTHSLDLDKIKDQTRLDLHILQNLDLPQESIYQSDTDTFKHLDSECEKSLYSTPREKVDNEMLAYDRVMPFDFITHRRAKKFFKEECYDINELLLESKKKPHTGNIVRDGAKSSEDEPEEDQLREVPELNDRLKKIFKIEPKQNKKRKKVKLTIKGEMSSSSDDERFEKYNYAQKVQNTQTRDGHNELVSMFFQRSQAKNPKTKREILERIVKFKQNIRPDQMKELQNRSFVIVDMKSLHNTKKLNLVVKKNVPQWVLDQRGSQTSLQDYDTYIDKQHELIENAKKNIMKEKSILKTRNPSITPLFIGQQSDVTSQDTYTQPIINRGSQTVTPMKHMEQSHSNLPQINTIRSTTPVKEFFDVASSYYQNSQRIVKPITSFNPMSATQSTTSSFTNFGTQRVPLKQVKFSTSQAPFMNTSSGFASATSPDRGKPTSVDLQHYTNESYKTYSQEFSLLNVKLALRDSPYQQIEHVMLQNEGAKKKNWATQQTKIRGYLVDKLKRKSILNSDLFKENSVECRNRTANMIERLSKVLGIKIKQKDKDE